MQPHVIPHLRSALRYSAAETSSRSRARRFLATTLCGLGFAAACAPLEAGVLQQVEVLFVPPSGPAVVDRDSVFVPTSAEVDRDILAQSSVTGQRTLAAAAGRFGQVGMQAAALSGTPGSTYQAEILVGSDEYVNVHGVPARARTQFIVDGGRLFHAFSRLTSVKFELEIGGLNQGFEPAADSELVMQIHTRQAIDFGSFDPSTGGRYSVTLATDVAGDRSFSISRASGGGLDLGASFDGNSTVEIPLSLQTLELGTLQPGERLHVGYRAALTIQLDGAVEGVVGTFSDPFTLDGAPNPIFALGGVTITPVPEPRIALMCLAGLALLCLRKRFKAAS